MRIEEESGYLKDLVYYLSHTKFENIKENEEFSEITITTEDPQKSSQPFIDFWIQQDHTSLYRQRKMPAYFIAVDRSDYPMYYSRDDQAMAYLVRVVQTDYLADQIITSISVMIRLDNYTDLLEKPTKSTASKRKLNQIINEYNLEVKLTLLSSVNENLKKIVYEAYFKFGIELKKKKENYYFGLKVDQGLKELL